MPPLDATLLALWHAAMPHHPMPAALWRQVTWDDPSFAPEDLILLEQAGELAGFALTKRYRGDFPDCGRYREVGWIALMAIAPAHQARGLGSRLLALAEARLAALGARRVQLGGSFHHAMPGVPTEAARAWFARRGYAPGKPVWDVRHALSQGLPARPAPAGIAFGPYPDARTLRLFLLDAFPGRWARDVSLWLERGGDLGTVIGAFRDDVPLGFCHTHPPGSAGALRWAGWNPHIAALGPIGVREDARGGGLGLGLLIAGLEALAARGADDTVIDWTDLLDFYARVGFTPWLGYTLMEKSLP